MIGYINLKYRGDGYGLAWPITFNGSKSIIKDIFGPRPFSPHIITVGYNYDFHRGIDLPASAADPIYSPFTGVIARLNYSHFGFEDDSQLSQFTLTTPSSALAVARSGSNLVMTCSRVGTVSYPSGLDMYQATTQRVSPTANDWVIEICFTSTPSITGSVGIGLFNGAPAAATEWIALEYDGTTFGIHAKSNGSTWTRDGYTSNISSKTWMRITYTLATNTYEWLQSIDGNTWVSITTEATKTWTSAFGQLIPTLYWKSGDTNVSPYTVNVDQLHWIDEDQTIGRFGNWMQIAQSDHKIVLVHFQSFAINLGDFVSVNQLIGYAGETGFDTRSGRILAEHCHLEYCQNNNRDYSNNDPINILAPELLPRINVSTNVNAVLTSANDPDGVASHRLTITVIREDQDFDLNEITLTGNTTSRTINWNTRSGLNADNDIPKQSGVYLVPSNFNESSASYVIDGYFNKSVVGTTFVSYIVKDTAGTTLDNGVVVSSVSPSFGDDWNTQSVTITGIGFTQAPSSITIDGYSGTNIARISDTQVTCNVPVLSTFAGAKDVVVTVNGKYGTGIGAYTYVLTPWFYSPNIWNRSDLGVTTISGAVSSWANQGTAAADTATNFTDVGNDFFRPTFNATDTDFNNYPSFSCPTNSIQLRTGTLAASISTPQTYVFVGKKSSTATDGTVYLGQISSATVWLYKNASDANLYIYDSSGATIGAHNIFIAIITYDGANSSWMLNSTTSNTVNLGAGNTITNLKFIAGNGGNNGAKGVECAIYSGALSLANRQSLMTALGIRYGITIS